MTDFWERHVLRTFHMTGRRKLLHRMRIVPPPMRGLLETTLTVIVMAAMPRPTMKGHLEMTKSLPVVKSLAMRIRAKVVVMST